MQLVGQVQRLTFNKSKFRSRRTMMEENLRAKKSFIQSYHIGKITIEILNQIKGEKLEFPAKT